VTRRDFLKASAAIGTALGLTATGVFKLRKSFAAEGALPIVWLQGQACTGCSVSLLNSIYYATIDDLLLHTLDLEYHPNVMAAAGSTAVAAAEAARAKGGYVLVVEGAIPSAASGKYCYVWNGVTMYNAVKSYAANAAYILAVGTCASFGGMAAGHPNPTSARSVKYVVGTKKPLINIPGCPAHPDWVVGTVAYILKNGKAPTLDSNLRPTDYYGHKVHENCPYISSYVGPNHHSGGHACQLCHGSNQGRNIAAQLGQSGCLYGLGCKGPLAGCDCSTRKWNTGAAATAGVNWCVASGSPCIGCTEPNFPDGMDPFFALDFVGRSAGGDD
jgi:hydrogenase small subunit